MNRILIIDDDQVQIEIVRRRLEEEGYEVLAAKNGKAGIELARKETPALILMDMIMSGMHGLEASIILKETPETKSIPIVALSAMASPKFIEECYKVGISGFIRKPADPKRVLEHVIKIVGKPVRKPLILAAAAESDLYFALKASFAAQGCRMTAVPDQNEFLADAAKKKPSLIVLDMEHLVADSLILLMRLRNIEGMDRIPIILMTASSPLKDVESEIESMGVAKILRRPFDSDLTIVREIKLILDALPPPM